MKNLFLISTAFQLINAIEAQKYFRTTNNILVLLYYGNQNKDHDQLKKTIDLFKYDELIIYDVSNQKSHLKPTIELINKIKSYQFENIFTGFFSANYRRFIANFKYKSLYLIDDGVYSISIQNELYGSNIEGYKKYILPYSEKKRETLRGKIKFEIYHALRKLYLLLNGCKNDMNNYKDLNFFTIFDIETIENEKIVKNDLTFFKSKLNYINKENENEKLIYFLGQPLNRAFSLSDATYISYLESIFDLYSDFSKIVYVPHRAEDTNIINIIQNKYSKQIVILEPKMPIELYIMENKLNINNIASFLSTALFSIKKLIPNINIDVYSIPVPLGDKKNVSLIYKILKKTNINMYYWKGNYFDTTDK
ncbi:MAG: hypothetical protein U9N59_13900 [Campylobacterota bacterium]|nr:hypothetical protein [Campylobacterota bacterium]